MPPLLGTSDTFPCRIYRVLSSNVKNSTSWINPQHLKNKKKERKEKATNFSLNILFMTYLKVLQQFTGLDLKKENYLKDSIKLQENFHCCFLWHFFCSDNV
jgi:hypothetical protein